VPSVLPEVAANAAFQAAPPRLTRPDALPANDIFGALVNQNAPGDLPAAPPPPPPAPPPQPSQAAPPPAENSPAANNNDSSASPANADSNNAANGNNSSSTEANANANGANASSQGSSTGQSTTTSSSGSAKSTEQKPEDSQGDAASNPTDAALVLIQQAGLVATTPTPVAVAAAVASAVATPSTNDSPPSSGTSTAPLAIAAAAIAASSQALAGPPGSPVQVKSGVETAANATATATVTTKTTPSTLTADAAGIANAGTQAKGAADPSAATNAVLTSTVVAPPPVNPKATQEKTSATPSSANNSSATTDSTPAASSSTGATTAVGQNAATVQAPTAGKPETPTAAVEGTAGAAPDGTASSQAVSARDHAGAASNNNVAHASADVPDPAASAIALVQPQLNSTSLAQASNLTVTAATNGLVPLSGVALQIAANVKNGKSSFDIRLDPAELGRIDVRVNIDSNGQVTSHLTVERPETLSLLRQDAPQLQQALNDAGLKTDSGGLQFSLRDQSSSGQNGGHGSNPNAHHLIISDDDPVPAAITGRGYGRSLGSSSGVDIRV
jgi:flagellar hook-length control protein FliK